MKGKTNASVAAKAASGTRKSGPVNEDRTLVLFYAYDAKGVAHLHRRWETVPGIRARLSAVASAPNGRAIIKGRSKG